jgi:uncharacterized protein YjbI with pentapeptide repeats
MNRNQFEARWADSHFLEQATDCLRSVFVEKTLDANADMRGLVVGLDGAIESLIHSDLQDAAISHVDLSFSRFSCPFSRCDCREVNFGESKFDTCRFKSSQFHNCLFRKAKMDSPILDDAGFLACSFDEAQIRGRGWNEYGGKRVVFENCRFDHCVFRNLQLRACKFIGCSFDRTAFRKCLISGASFSGMAPDLAAFEDCELIQCSLNGESLVV